MLNDVICILTVDAQSVAYTGARRLASDANMADVYNNIQ